MVILFLLDLSAAFETIDEKTVLIQLRDRFVITGHGTPGSGPICCSC